MEKWLGCGVLSAIVLMAPPLAAAPIEWDAPADCPGTESVLEGLRQALESDVIELGAVSRVRGVVVAEREAPMPRYRLTLEVVAGERRSSRTFEAEHCDDLARTAALAVSLAVHSSAAGSKGALAAFDSTGASLEGAVEEPPSVAPQPGSDEDAVREGSAAGAAVPLWWSGGANAVVDFGGLPEPAIGIGLGARAGFDAWEFDIHASLLPSQRQAVGVVDSVDLGLMVAGLRACRHLLDRALMVAACVGAEAGRFTAVGVSLDPGREVHDPWLAIGPSALARTLFEGPLQLELLAEALLPLARKQYAVNGTEEVHTPSVVSFRLQLGLVIGGTSRANPR